MQLTVKENPVRSLELTASRNEARTGDVIHFKAIAKNEDGKTVPDVAISYALLPDPIRAGRNPSGREPRRRSPPPVVSSRSSQASLVARYSVRITPRDVTQKIEFVGHARVSDRVTADLWAWEGIDGRDYAAHGTWNAEGHAYFYDVTDPANMELIDKVQVDARTVNDVKVSEDGRICVISREGASNRRNGIVILDVSNPRDVKILSQFDDHLTGEVHKRVRLSEPRLRGQRRPALGRGQHRGSEEAGTGGTLRDHHPGPRGARCLGTGRNCFPSGSNGWLDCGGCRGRRSRGGLRTGQSKWAASRS